MRVIGCKRMEFLLLALTLAVCSKALPQEATTRVTLSHEEIAEVKFDQSRVSLADVRRWILLSGHGPYNQADVVVQPCFADGATSEDLTKRLASTRERLAKFDAQTAELSANSYPAELGEVIDYLRSIRSLWSSIDSRLVTFCETGSPTVLESKVEDVDSRVECGRFIDQVRSSRTPKDARRWACFDWSTCVLRAGEKQIGSYPRKAWLSFLEKYGIQEKILSTETD